MSLHHGKILLSLPSLFEPMPDINSCTCSSSWKAYTDKGRVKQWNKLGEFTNPATVISSSSVKENYLGN
jgi:hypothetical protein